jgi:hypothetical protein
MAITRRMVEEWLQSEVTRAYRAGIKEQINNIKESMARGSTLYEFAEQNTARAVGRIEGLEDALEVDVETAIEGD